MAGCRSVATVTSQVEMEVVSKFFHLPSETNDSLYFGLKKKNTTIAFYKQKNFQTVWGDTKGIFAQTDSLLRIIQLSRRFGLLPQDYHQAEVNELYHRKDSVSRKRFDLLLTDAFFKMVSDLGKGRLIKPTATVDSTAITKLNEALTSGDFTKQIESFEPNYIQYKLLKRALNNFIDSLALHQKQVLFSGVTYDSVEAHRTVRTIEINMERWRMEKEILNDTYVWVNIPSYNLRVMNGEEVMLQSRIIVGKPSTPTPVFSSKIDCFILYPYWHVPRKITVEEFLPAIKKDTVFLSRNRFDVLDKKGNIVSASSINWSQLNATNFPYRLRQREGSDNALGVIKFNFDNPYAVYLHDTNNKTLFNAKRRALSHGCVRVESYLELAKFLIRDSTNKIAKQLEENIARKKRQSVNVIPAVPVHLRYITCEVVGGRLIIYPDIYKTDINMVRRIYLSYHLPAM